MKLLAQKSWLLAQINWITRTSWIKVIFLSYLNCFNVFLGNGFLEQIDNSYLYLFYTSVYSTRLLFRAIKHWNQRLDLGLVAETTISIWSPFFPILYWHHILESRKLSICHTPKCTFLVNTHSLPQKMIITLTSFNINKYINLYNETMLFLFFCVWLLSFIVTNILTN